MVPRLTTPWGPDKMAAISQKTPSNALSWTKMSELWLKFQWRCSQGYNWHYSRIGLIQIMAWCRPQDNPLSKPMMVRSPRHICVTRPEWINSHLSHEGQWHPLMTVILVKTGWGSSQAITWNNIDLSLVRLSDNYLEQFHEWYVSHWFITLPQNNLFTISS